MTGSGGQPRTWRGRFGIALGVALICLCGLAPPRPARATPGAQPRQPEQGLLCRSAIRDAERGRALPPFLLGAIGRVESGRGDPITGRVHPWPWSINAEGRDFVFDSKTDAIDAARRLLARGVKSFDVGCMQINMMYHPDAFRDLDEAFDPEANARYAADFLTTLKEKTGNWADASAGYHSFNPELGREYRSKVEQALIVETRDSGDFTTLPAVDASAGMVAGMPSAVRSLPGSRGNSVVLNAHPSGVMLPLPGTAGGAISASASPGGAAMQGRGLDAYRARPVMILASRTIFVH